MPDRINRQFSVSRFQGSWNLLPCLLMWMKRIPDLFTLSPAARIRQPNKNNNRFRRNGIALMLVSMMYIRPMRMGVDHGMMLMGMVV